MIHALREFYGLQPSPPGELFQFLVWEIVSDHALPARRDLAWQALRRLPALTPDAMFRAPARELLDAVGIAGAHREEKVEQLRTLVGEFRRHRNLLDTDALSRTSLLAAARALGRVEHVSRAIRGRALLFSLGHPVLPIDDDVNRVVSRLMGTPDNRRHAAARHWLAAALAREASSHRDGIVYLRHHAHHTCLKAGPHCGVCPLRPSCGFAAHAR